MNYQVKDLSVNTEDMTVFRGDKQIDLTKKEYQLLLCLLRYRGKVIQREVAMVEVWNAIPEFDSKIVDRYIAYLRRKIDTGFEQKLIQTVRKYGYVIW